MDKNVISIIEYWMRNSWSSMFNHDGMQIFITNIPRGYADAFQCHVDMLMNSFLYAEYQKEEMPHKPGYLNGFLEHYGRLPNENDRYSCHVTYFGDRWFKIVRNFNGVLEILSECKLTFTEYC